MKQATLFILVAVVFAGTLVLWGGTRSATDIKGPVFAAGALILAVAALGDALSRGLKGEARRLGWFALLCAVYPAYTLFGTVWAGHSWIVKYIFAERCLWLVLSVSVSIVVARTSSWRFLAGSYVALGAVVAAFSLVWHGIYVPRAMLAKSADAQLWQVVKASLMDLRAPAGNANLLAAVLVLPMLMAAAFIVREWGGRRRRWMLAAEASSLVAMMSVFVLCRAVSYWVALFAAGVVFAMLRAKRPARVVVFAAATVIAVAAGMYLGGGVDRFKASKSYLVRAELYRRAGLMFEKRPVLGWGAGNFFTDGQVFAGEEALRVVRYYEGGALKEEPVHMLLTGGEPFVHNEYLEQAAEGGIVGLGVYVLLVGAALTAGLTARSRGFEEKVLLEGALAAFVAYLVANVFNPEVHFADFGPQFWVLAGMLAAARAATMVEAAAGEETGAGRWASKWVTISAAAVLAGIGIASFAVGDYGASREYVRGERVYGKRAFTMAAGHFLAAADDTWDPVLRARALYMAGYSYKQAGDDDSAYQVFETASLEFDALMDVDFQTAYLLEQAGLYAKAIVYYQRHLAGHSNDSEKVADRVAMCEAFINLENHQVDKAVETGRDYFSRHGEDHAARRRFLSIFMGLDNEYVEAFEEFVKFLAAKGTGAEDAFLSGQLALRHGDAKGAEALIRRGMDEGYVERDAYYYLGEALVAQGRLTEAAEVVNEGRGRHPSCTGLATLEKAITKEMREAAVGSDKP